MKPELVLRGVFIHLIKHGFQLGVRDYLDGLRALRAGYGGNDRRALLWLCQTLWARTEAEARAVALLFDHFPLPTPDEVAALTGVPWSEASPNEAGQCRAAEPRTETGAIGEDRSSELGLSFTPSGQGGLGLPRARTTLVRNEVFILTPRPVVPLRTLVIAWRRFRIALRTGPRVELDLEATVAAKCRIGLLEEPVLVPRRRNQARVVVLVDASASMQPWHGINALLDASLQQGQLGAWAMLYFDNVPELLYRDEHLLHPEPVEHVLRAHARSTLLVISDAGAARGTRSRERVRATEQFFSAVHPQWHSAAWLNPMPRGRWKGSSAEAISRLRSVSMFELSEDGLVGAVDVLRGRAS